MNGGGNDESEDGGSGQGHGGALEAGKKETVIDESENGGDDEEVVENDFVLNKRGNGGEVGGKGSDDKQKPNGDLNLPAIVSEFFDFHFGQVK